MTVPMSGSFTVPKVFKTQAEALRPLVRSMRARMLTSPPQTAAVSDIFELIQRHLDRIATDVPHFACEIEAGLGQAGARGDATDAEIFRAVGRLEVLLDRILDGYDEVRCLRANADDFEGWKLLVETYRGTLVQVQSWLDELVNFLHDPIAGLKKRGISAEGDAEVTFSLDLQAPPELDQLTEWSRQRSYELASGGGAREVEFIVRDPDWDEVEPPRPWLLVILGALFGWMIGSG